MYEQFLWRGKAIRNIRQWAADRGERLIWYRAERTVPSLTGRLKQEVRIGFMPESFWNNMCMTDGWCYTKLD